MCRRWLWLVLVLAGCGGSPRVSLTARGATPFADSPATVRVSGLPAGGRGTLAASWTSFGGTRWVSRTPLRADGHGVVRLGGTRFLWAMKPARPTGAKQGFGPPVGGPSVVRLSVLAGSKTVARTVLSRRITPPSVRIRDLTVQRDGVYGFLFTPAGHARRPAVLAFGGSEGGVSAIDEAGLLAAHGYPALALAYFQAPGLPSHLVRIPLEYFARAGRILRAQPDADPAHIVTLGVSYGGEASLLVAATFPHLFHGAIALVPSARVTSGLPGLGGAAAAWTLHGRAVPEGPIAVERISGPVLAQGAGSDGEWPSADAVAQIRRRLKAHRFRFSFEGVVYPRAGHYSGIAVPNLPEPTDQPSVGGSPSADAAARRDLWNRIQRYLARI